MAYRPQFGSKHRDYVYSAAKADAYLAGRGDHPICPHCDQPVTPGQAWDEVHVDVPRCFGGKAKAVGHRRCNERDNNEVVTPAAAKARAVHKKHVGIKGPGLGRHPMRCGRRSNERKTMRHGVQPRRTLGERHREFVRQRFFLDIEDIDGPIEVQP